MASKIISASPKDVGAASQRLRSRGLVSSPRRRHYTSCFGERRWRRAGLSIRIGRAERSSQRFGSVSSNRSSMSAMASRRGASPLRHAAPHQPNLDPASSCEDGPPGRDGPEGSSSPLNRSSLRGRRMERRTPESETSPPPPLRSRILHAMGPTMSRVVK